MSILADDQLSRASFLLFSASAIPRYERLATRLAHEYGLVDRLARSSDAVDRALRDAQALAVSLSTKVERDDDEVDLALLLAALATQEGHDGVTSLLRVVGSLTAPGARWSAALARSRLRARSGNVDQQTPNHSVSYQNVGGSDGRAYLRSQKSEGIALSYGDANSAPLRRAC